MTVKSRYKRFETIQRRIRACLIMIVCGAFIVWYGVHIRDSHTGLDMPVMVIGIAWSVLWIIVFVFQIRLLRKERDQLLLSGRKSREK